MITLEERLYYIDPVQPATMHRHRADETPKQVVALRYRRGNHVDRIGRIIEVTHQRHENNELWWVDTDGDYVYGAPLQSGVGVSGNVMAIVNDDLFVVGRNGGQSNARSALCIINSPIRSDGRVFGFLTARQQAPAFAAAHVLKAAPWAVELMPARGDSAAVIEKKVELAKLKFMHRLNKAEIYKEGMRRDWLNELDNLRPTHDMPTPQFSVGAAGTMLVRMDESVPLDTLPENVQRLLSRVTENSVTRPDPYGVAREGRAAVYHGVQYSTITTLRVSSNSEMNGIPERDFAYAVTDRLAINGQLTDTSRFPVLTNF